MAPKSSDGETMDGSSSDPELTQPMDGSSELTQPTDGSSSEPEGTQPMETSTGVDLSLLGKRRAENRSPDDSSGSEQFSNDEAEDEGEEDEGEGEDEGVEFDGDDESELVPVSERVHEVTWGYDSFEDLEEPDTYNRRLCSDDELETQWRHYRQQLFKTKGFFETTDKFPTRIYAGIAWLGDLDKPAMLGLTTRQVCEKLTSLCLERYNEDEGKNVKLDHIVRANFDPSSMTKFYITFAARESESPDAPLVEYQAKAAWSVQHKLYPILCRPAPPKRAMEETTL